MVLDQPPEQAEAGACYLVGADPSGDWAGQANCLAARIGSSWHFIPPSEGMEIYDRSTGRKLLFRSQWLGPQAPEVEAGGAVIDVQARAAIAELITALQGIGIFAGPA
jgi:hypothetical protein